MQNRKLKIENSRMKAKALSRSAPCLGHQGREPLGFLMGGKSPAIREQRLTPMSMDSILSNMKAMTYTAAREGLASAMDQVCRERAPLLIMRKREQAVVMLSLDEYEALEETAHLLRSPANARRLLAA